MIVKWRIPDKHYPTLFKYKAGHLALDFCNTVHWHKRPQPTELLATYAHVLAWTQHAAGVPQPGGDGIPYTAGAFTHSGLPTPREARRLLTLAYANPDRAEQVRDRAAVWREALYRVLVARVAGRLAPKPDLAVLNRAAAEADRHAELVVAGDCYRRVWAFTDLDSPLWPIVRAATDLLCSPNLDRVGQCADARGCGWLFLDTSKNRSRRWCSMDDCGSLSKARAYYLRKSSSRVVK